MRRARAHRPDIAVLADLGGPKLRLGDLRAEIQIAAGDTIKLGGGGMPVADPSLYRSGAVRRSGLHRRRDAATSSRSTSATTASSAGCGSAGRCARARGSTCPTTSSSLPGAHRQGPGRPRRPRGAGARLRRRCRTCATSDDIAEARTLTDLPLVAKIEKQQALERLDAIIAAADAIMVARGDLGVEIPIERVPAVAEADHPRRQPRGPAGDHGDADAGVDGDEPAADARRGDRRRERGARRHRRRDAVGGDGGRPRSRRAWCG